MIVQLAPAARGLHVIHRGRRIGWSEWGDERGRPVVFCTGAGMTSSMGFGAAALDGLGVRLLCIDRAGLGRSEPDPDKSFASYAADVAAVLDHLGIARPAVVGFSQGAPFALALAAHASRIALVAGQDELAHPAIRAQLHPEVAGMVDAIAADAAGFAEAFAARVDAAGLWALIIGMSAPTDRAIYDQPAFAAAYQQTLGEGFARGPAGYVQDLVLAMQPWPMAPERIEVPVDLWYGALDTSPVHSPDLGTTLAARLPRATRRVVAGEGGSLLWTRAAEILGALDARD
ncbi:MAG: alpha/beta fold hydrolase [Kofleriaceae bacterium]